MQQAKKQGRRGKRPDDRPARRRYWNSGKLDKRKISRIAFNRNIPYSEAEKVWLADRTRRTSQPRRYPSNVRYLASLIKVPCEVAERKVRSLSFLDLFTAD